MNEKKNPANDSDLVLLVTERKLVADHVIELVLRAADDSALPPWTAGAHIDVVLEGEPQLVRQYSLSGSPSHADSWRIAVLRERDGRGGQPGYMTRLASVTASWPEGRATTSSLIQQMLTCSLRAGSASRPLFR